MATCWL